MATGRLACHYISYSSVIGNYIKEADGSKTKAHSLFIKQVYAVFTLSVCTLETFRWPSLSFVIMENTGPSDG